ncbi:MAG: TonB-dependent receptor [Sphingomonas sp.]
MLAQYRSRLLTSTLLVGAAVIATPSFAQTADPASQPKTGVQSNDPAAPAAGVSTQDSAPPAGQTSGGDIVVTGTLIRNPNLIASSPVAVVGQEEINLRQTNTAEEILRDLPGAVPSIGSAVNNGNGGSSFADLRGLGNFRNVVLLDGNRLVPSSTVGRVDLNNIPLALVERVDTLTGGAATTYGADAVSGVINFITRSDFSGMELGLSKQITERGDGPVSRADLTVGANFDDGRGNAVLSIGYQKADPVYQGARKFSVNNYTSTTGAAGGSGTTVPGRFTLGSAFNTIRPDGSLTPYKKSTDAFNFNPYNIFQTPFERYNIYAAAHYDVSDNIEVYSRGMFSKNKVDTIIAPSGLFSSVVTVPLSNPFLPAAARAQFCANNDFDFNTPGVQTLTPAQCNAGALATNPNDPNFRAFTTTVGRRTTELGPRLSHFTTQFFDYRAGVKIGLTKSINLDLNGSYGESENRLLVSGFTLTSRIRTAVYTSSATSCNLGPSPTITDPSNGLTIAGAGAGTTAGSGCVPLNLFGPDGSITPAMASYITAASSSVQQSTLAQARAVVSGDVGASLPWAANPIGFALGAEYRRYSASQTADTLANTAGELGGAGGATANFSGGYDVKEAYGELIAPIVQDAPGFKSLTLEAGIRYSSYKVFAPNSPSYNTTTYKLGGSWETFGGIKLRGNYQRAVRAPNIAELFSPNNTGLTNLSTDPCAGQAPVNNANLRAVCLAQGAPAASIGAITNPTSAQANATSGGGTYLRPETSDSFTGGVVLQPRFVPGFSLTVDYYNINIKNAISTPTPNDVVNNCFNNITASSATNPLCLLLKRDPVLGTLSGDPATTPGLLFPASNSGHILTDGIDVGVTYRRNLGFAKLNLSFQGNWTHRSIFQSTVPGSVIPPGYVGAGTVVPASQYRECVGLYSTSCGSPGSAGPSSAAGSLQPKFTWNQRTTLTFGPIDFSLLWRHIGEMNAEPGVVAFKGTIQRGALAGQTVDFSHIKPYDYFDFSTRFGVGEHFDLTFTVQNLFDRDPPITGSTIGSTTFNSGNTYPSTYDTLGRRFAVGARVKF